MVLDGSVHAAVIVRRLHAFVDIVCRNQKPLIHLLQIA